jgi:site-specific DNA-methyltransferase (adenine-specific)
MDGEAKNVKLAEQAVDAEEDCRRMELMGEDSFVPDVRHCSMCDLLDSLSGVDAIVTDPPYPQEFLPLYGDLARLAAKALKPDGILAVMCGETWLPEIMALMSPHIPYRWTMAYLTPGGQAVQVWPRKVNTFWKPILLFGGSPEWIGDVVQSSVNDNDKRFHEWGQSQSGMMDLLDRLTRVGDLVCDPFLGAGTTGVAAVAMSRRFIGCDINRDHVKTASDRIRLAVKMSEGP